MSKNAHHVLSDVMLMIPDCISLCGVKGSLRKFFATRIPPGTDLQPCRERTRQLIVDLNRWAEAYPYLASLPLEDSSAETNAMDSAVGSVQIAKPRSNAAMLPPDSFIALSVATYESVRLLLTLLLHKINTEDTKVEDDNIPGSPPATVLNDLAIESAETVLKVTRYLETTKSAGFDFIRSVTPLVIVAILGPGEDQFTRARIMLKRWGDNRGLGGLVGAWLHI